MELVETRMECYLVSGNHCSDVTDEADLINQTDYIDYILLKNCVTFVITINQTDGIL